MSYFYNILTGIDQVGNSIAGGNPDNTLSGRVGFLKQRAHNLVRWYWIFIAFVLDTIFRPIDGKDHCRRMYDFEREFDFEDGNDVVRFFLSVMIVVLFPFLLIVLGPLVLMKLIKPVQGNALDLIDSDLQRIKRITRHIEYTSLTQFYDSESQIPEDFLDDLLSN